MEKLCEGPHVHADSQPARFVARLQGILLPNTGRDGSVANFCFNSTFEFFKIGPKRRLTAMQRYVRSWNTSRHGTDIVNVPLQPRHASLIGGEPGSSSGSLAMLAAMRRASSRVSKRAADLRPGSSSK
jgi:hypothetical protein